MVFCLSEIDLDRLYVLRNVLSGQQSRIEAAHELGIGTRQLRRLLVRLKAEGSSGIKPRYHGGNRKFSEDFKAQIMFLVKTNYSDFGPVLAKEKLEEIHDLRINKETLRQWMIEAGLRPTKKRKAARIHHCRSKRSRVGELVQIDGSHHDWFEGRGPRCCLIIFIDDVTSRIQTNRKLSKNLEFSYESALYQIQGQGHGYRLRHAEVTVCENMDESIEVFRGEQQPLYACRAKSMGSHVCDEKGLDELLERKVLFSASVLRASL